jgi:Mg-chelatase subunit ChlD
MLHRHLRSRLGGHALFLVLAVVAALFTAPPASGDLAPTDPTSAAAAAPAIARGGSTEVTVSVTGTTRSAATPTDIMLVADESASLTTAQFGQVKQFGRDLVAHLDAEGFFAEHGGRVGVAMFASSARGVLPLAAGTTATSVSTAINSVVQRGGNTCLTCAVEFATGMFAASSPPERNRVMVLLTDGIGNVRTSELTARVAASDAAGVERFVVGVGSVSQAEIRLIATDPDSEHAFTAAGFNELLAMVDEVAGAVDAPAAHDAQVSIDVPAPFTASSPSTSHGTATVTADGLRWDIGTLGAETATLTYTATHDGSTTCGPDLPVQSASYSDAEGTSGVEFAPVTVDVTGCPAALEIDPVESDPTAGTVQERSATVVDDFGAPVGGATVTYEVTSGPNAGATTTAVTGSAGVATASFTSTSVGADVVRVTVDDVTATATIDWQSPWPWSGFDSPVADPPSVNVVNAGSAVPVKFGLGGDRGSYIFAAGSPYSVPTSCSDGSPLGAPVHAEGADGLRYDAARERYSFVWKTDKSWTGCRTLVLEFVNGMTQTALFRMR